MNYSDKIPYIGEEFLLTFYVPQIVYDRNGFLLDTEIHAQSLKMQKDHPELTYAGYWQKYIDCPRKIKTQEGTTDIQRGYLVTIIYRKEIMEKLTAEHKIKKIQELMEDKYSHYSFRERLDSILKS